MGLSFLYAFLSFPYPVALNLLFFHRERPDIVKGELSETMLATVEIVDTFVQCLLRVCMAAASWFICHLLLLWCDTIRVPSMVV